MAKRKPEEAPPGAPAWQTTFSDLMNLLLCFFVLLFSMSSVDAEKFQELVASFSQTFSVLPSGGSTLTDSGVLVSSGASQLNALSTKYNNTGLNSSGDVTQDVESAYEEYQKEGLAQSEQMAEDIEAGLHDKNLSDVVEVTATNKYVLLNMNGAILFENAKADLGEEAISIIDRVADVIKKYDDNVISIEGHTDNIQINNAEFPNNMMLSLHRAYAVFSYFVYEKGFDPTTLMSTGRGESVPIASNSTPEGRAQNRRVEIKIYNNLNSQ